VAQLTIEDESLAPSKSIGFYPGGNNLIVGYPPTPYWEQTACSAVQSTFPTLTSPFNLEAASAHSGANFWQCPHHGA